LDAGAVLPPGFLGFIMLTRPMSVITAGMPAVLGTLNLVAIVVIIMNRATQANF